MARQVEQVADQHLVVGHAHAADGDGEGRVLREEAGADVVAVHERGAAGVQLACQRPAPQRVGHVQVGYGVALVGLYARRVEERHVEPDGVEVEVAVGRGRIGARHGGLDVVGGEAPEHDADVRDVVTPAAGGDAAHVERTGDGVERAADALDVRAAAQVGRDDGGAHVVQVLGRDEQPEVLDEVRRPAGHVAGEQLEDRGGTLGAAVADGVGHLGARGPEAGGGAREGQRAVPDEVADVGHDPVGARLDELVVVELRDVLLDARDLLRQDAEQRLERPAAQRVVAVLLRVAQTVDGREQREQALAVEGRHARSPSSKAAGLTLSSSAPVGVPPLTMGPAATRRGAMSGSAP